MNLNKKKIFSSKETGAEFDQLTSENEISRLVFFCGSFRGNEI